jgi:phosphonate transport system substrate-binding protein
MVAGDDFDPPTPIGTEPSLRFGLVPTTDTPEVRAHVREFCASLARHLGHRVKPLIAHTPHELVWAFADSRVDLAWISPSLFVMGLDGVTPLASSVREGATVYHGVLFVESGSRFRSVYDLRGARVAWAANTSASGYVFPRLALASHGLDPRTLFGHEECFGSHGDVAREVLSGRVDVGATFATFEDGDATREIKRAGFLDAAPGRSARIVFVTPAIPADLIVARSGLSAEVSANTMAWLRELSNDESAAKSVRVVIGAEAFRQFRPEELAPLRAQIEDGRTLGLID